ncbi:hypothetical protein K402DRAFT_396007 [Aulographum hederae CBS 113979]|uniref:Uncharacterized protein n=1 Tax=Aulographum hederae CBS 113979 TaxID=1176131 RepID=A0A6G1GSZ2_9PEZI|nr:hypothetical protein K402DRAFT_396007 [Aulographum hederae CBS 113979]
MGGMDMGEESSSEDMEGMDMGDESSGDMEGMDMGSGSSSGMEGMDMEGDHHGGAESGSSGGMEGMEMEGSHHDDMESMKPESMGMDAETHNSHHDKRDGMPGMENEGGLKDVSASNVTKPCSDCTLKWAKASVTYPDGTEANIDTGVWLHHMTLSIVGPGRVDLACPQGTERIPKNWERLLAFHNDRNETFFGMSGSDEMGFYLGPEDNIELELLLKNEVNVPKEAQFHIDWEFAPGKPAGWGAVRGIWMDIAACDDMMSDIAAPKDQKQFELEGPAWKSWIDGELLTTVGHGHDGLAEIDILNNGQAICESKTSYGTKSGYTPGAQALSLGAQNISHISNVSPCLSLGKVKQGDSLMLKASYDFDKYKPALNKIGESSEVMGVAMMFVKIDQLGEY